MSSRVSPEFRLDFRSTHARLGARETAAILISCYRAVAARRRKGRGRGISRRFRPRLTRTFPPLRVSLVGASSRMISSSIVGVSSSIERSRSTIELYVQCGWYDQPRQRTDIDWKGRRGCRLDSIRTERSRAESRWPVPRPVAMPNEPALLQVPETVKEASRDRDFPRTRGCVDTWRVRVGSFSFSRRKSPARKKNRRARARAALCQRNRRHVPYNTQEPAITPISLSRGFFFSRGRLVRAFRRFLYRRPFETWRALIIQLEVRSTERDKTGLVIARQTMRTILSTAERTNGRL